MARPVIFVLAGVNGAGKSTAGERELTQAGLTWFNPDTFTRQLIKTTGAPPAEANAAAWQAGVRQLDAAIAGGTSIGDLFHDRVFRQGCLQYCYVARHQLEFVASRLHALHSDDPKGQHGATFHCAR